MKWNNNIKARDSLLLCGSNKVPPDTEPVALPIAPRSFLAKTLGWLDLLRKRTQNQFYMLDSSQGKKWYATHSTRWYLKIKLEFWKKDRQKTQQKQLQLLILNKNLLAVDVSETGIQEHTYWPDCYQVTSSTWTKTCPFWRNLSQNWWKTRDCCVTCPALARDEGGVYIPVLATLGEWIGLPYLK